LITKEENNKLTYTLLLLVILIVTILRLRFIDFPLERDEGGFAYMGKLILRGIPPYISGYDFKPPGLYLTYALFLKIFGQTANAIHIGLLLFNAGSMALIFEFTKRLLGRNEGIISALIYGMLALAPGVLGFAAHATHFVVFWMLLGLVLIMQFHKTGNKYLLISSGVAFSLSVLMKQPGLLFLGFGIVLLFYPTNDKKLAFSNPFKKISLFIAGIILPFAFILLWYWNANAVDKFIFWNFEYGLKFSNLMKSSDGITELIMNFPKVARDFLPVWIIAAIAFIMILADKKQECSKVLIILFLITSVVAVSLGLHFRKHYFVMMLPIVGILTGYVINKFTQALAHNKTEIFILILSLFIILSITGYGIIINRSYFIYDDLNTLSRRLYHPNPFADSETIAKYIQTKTEINDKIAILGSEPQILFYADRLSATPYLFTYFIMEPHPYSLSMQKEMAGNIEMEKPKLLIYINHPISWVVWQNSQMYIFTWADKFIKEYYSLAGLVDVVSAEKSIIKWGEEANSYPDVDRATVLIFERN
jgi:hypothetical protein